MKALWAKRLNKIIIRVGFLKLSPIRRNKKHTKFASLEANETLVYAKARSSIFFLSIKNKEQNGSRFCRFRVVGGVFRVTFA